MKNKTPITELQRMTPDELRRDLTLRRAEAAKMRIAIGMQSEKNHALYRTHRRDIARMTMVLQQMMKNPVSAPAPKTAPAAKTPEKASQKAKKPVKSAGSKKVKSKKSA